MARTDSTSSRELNYVLFVALFIIIIVVSTTARNSREIATSILLQRAADTLSVYASNLSSELDNFRTIPLLLTYHPKLTEALNNPADPAVIQTANELLANFNSISNALDTYLLDQNGRTIVASNWNTEYSFIGEELGFRPYFQDAISQGTGYYFALGNTSLKRGYYFSAAIYADGNFNPIDRNENSSEKSGSQQREALGVVTVKISLDELEHAWSQVYQRVAVTDEDGVIFIASQQDWIYHTMEPISEQKRQEIIRSRRYANQPLNDMGFKEIASSLSGARLVTLDSDSKEDNATFLHFSKPVPEKGWILHTMLDYSYVRTHTRQSAIAAGSVAALALALLTLVFIKAQARTREAQIIQSAYANMEQQVKRRTEELSAAQDNLVQAAKMAALGEMATSITHELNQPLSAIRTFADNALEYLKRRDTELTNTNLHYIIGLSEKMNVITRNLKAFARKTPFRLEVVSVDHVIRETLTLMQPAIQQADARLHYEQIPASITVRAEPVRLQQVFTNLIHNAVDAVKPTEEKNISISSEQDNGHILISVADSGTGIEDSMLDRLYEPFSSSKEAGEGLGLGLSLSYGIIEEFGGTITAKNAKDQGAVFTVRLRLTTLDSGVSD